MDKIEETELVTQVLDLNAQDVNEITLAMQGNLIKTIMGSMFGDYNLPVEIRGSPAQLGAFAAVLGKEKAYMEAFSKYGLDNANTYRNRANLDAAVRKFENVTRLKWPFK